MMAPIGPPPIAENDTVLVAGHEGRWIVDTIHFGTGDPAHPRYVSDSRNHSFVRVSQSTGGGNGYPYHTSLVYQGRVTVLEITDPATLTFVRRGNELDDELLRNGDNELVRTPRDNVIKQGRITTVQAVRAAID
jgi:hypothetical protein